MNETSDRRRLPRHSTRFAVRKIRQEEKPHHDVSVFCETRNINRHGAYCLSTQDFPEFARIRITLELKTPDAGKSEDLECEGVVVRADGKMNADGKDLFGFAVFFDRMSEENRRKIDHYVEQHQIARPAEPSSS